MAVQKSRKTPSKRGMHRSHSALPLPAVSIDAKSGETHSRHRISREGFYRGRKVLQTKADAAAQFLEVGEHPRDQRLDTKELAAYSNVASLILNFDETVTRE